MNRQFPRLEVHLPRLRNNATQVISRCNNIGIDVCGIIKGVHALPEIAKAYRECGATQLGTSRLEQIVRCREAGIPGPYLLIRIPAMTELPDVVRYADISMHSELATLDALEAECAKQNKTHSVIVMADLGDLREGFWDHDELVDVCRHVELDLPHLHLSGIGVNLSCYGAIKPTPEKMNNLLDIAHKVESAIGRKLETISGGGTTSYPLVHVGTMPQGINHLRIGENVLLGKDLQLEWGIKDMDYLDMNTFTLKAEVIEVKEKPSYPQGEFCIDAFCNVPTFEDKGIQRRALLALGRADVGNVEALFPRDKNIEVIGASSDHCILDVTHASTDIKVGDIVSFSLSYVNMLYVTGRSDVNIVMLEE